MDIRVGRYVVAAHQLLSIDMFAKVFAKVVAFTEQFTARLGPPLPLETLGFRPVERASAEPDYPSSTCYVRVVRLGFGWAGPRTLLLRGRGRAKPVGRSRAERCLERVFGGSR
jgi:hypothetical protein